MLQFASRRFPLMTIELPSSAVLEPHILLAGAQAWRSAFGPI